MPSTESSVRRFKLVHKQDLEPTYFTTTLDVAAKLNSKAPERTWKTINEFLDYQAETQPELFAVGFPVPGTSKDEIWGSKLFTFKTLRDASLAVARSLREDIETVTCDDENQVSCIALLCESSTEFLLTWLAIIRCGFSALLIAPHCQPTAIAHLCTECKASVLYHSEAYKDPATISAEEKLAVHKSRDLRRAHSTIMRQQGSEFQPFQSTHEFSTAYIHHTSGTSSGLPKPIPQSHRAAAGVLPSLDGKTRASFTTTPLYHGGIADCFRAWTSDAMIWLFPAVQLPITSQNIQKCLFHASQCTASDKTPSIKYFSSVPYVLEMLNDEDGLSWLRKMDLVGVGGAALPVSLGDSLVSRGINLISRFGSAECGFLLSSHRRDHNNDKAWQYLRAPKNSPLLKFEKKEESELCELVIQKGWPHMTKKNRPDSSYATSDLFEPHPEIENAWRYHSRSDSQITLMTGKKFDPAPFEDEISNSSSHVKDALVFGNGKQFPGVLIFPHINIAASDLGSFKRKIWTLLKPINAKSQDYSRISKSMVVIMKPASPPLEKSSKGTLLRGSIEKRFHYEIEGAYDTADGTQTARVKVADINVDEFVRTTVEVVLGWDLERNASFYHSGVDSTKATQIRSLIQMEMSLPSSLPWNVVYDCGNIHELSKYIIQLRNGKAITAREDVKAMRQLAEEYSKFETVKRAESDDRKVGDVIILTGATGALGAHILDIVRHDPSVNLVICLVRARNRAEATKRVQTSLKVRKKGDSLTDGAMVWGFKYGDLPRDIFNLIKSRRATIIHAAWPVNFSLPLGSFEESIADVQRLIKLALSFTTLANFVFCSSTASILEIKRNSIPESISDDPTTAGPLGYSKSKWVAEAICKNASRLPILQGRVKIARIGQLTGDTENGIWNMKEAWPLMLSTVHELNCLPNFSNSLNWLPLDAAAKAVVDIASLNGYQEEEYKVYHVVSNYHKATWRDLLQWLLKSGDIDFKIVDGKIWLEKLEKLKSHPAKALLGLWKGIGKIEVEESSEAMIFETKNVEEVSEIMRSVPVVDEMLVGKIWRWMEIERAGQ